MTEKERATSYAAKRMQAQRNCVTHINDILYSAAKSIVSLSTTYRNGNRLEREANFLSKATSVIEKADEKIENYIVSYSKASCKFLGVSTDAVDEYLAGSIYGKTLQERSAMYLSNFAKDIVNMVKAGISMGYDNNKILSAIRTGYKDPYTSSVVTKAQKKNFNIVTPSYGKGIYRSAYQNIIRNARGIISLAWSAAERQYGEDNGAVGFIVKRGSSYPCAVCDDEVAKGVQSLEGTGSLPPLHARCVCSIEFVFKED